MKTDIEIISELKNILPLQRIKKKQEVAGLIDSALLQDFGQTSPEYTNAIFEIKERISNISHKCNTKYTLKIVTVSGVIMKLEGGI